MANAGSEQQNNGVLDIQLGAVAESFKIQSIVIVNFHRNDPLGSHSARGEKMTSEDVVKHRILVDGVVHEVESGVPMMVKVDDWEEDDLRWCRACPRSDQRILHILYLDYGIWK